MGIFEIIGKPLGWIMYWCYLLLKDYGFALILFTLVTKILLLPLSIKQQKSTARMQSFQPKLQKLQKMYANNKQKFQEEQMKLYSEEGVNPMGSCLPLLIQMPILFGLYDVVAKPLTHILRLGSQVKEATNIMLSNLSSFESLKNVAENLIQARPETYIIKAVHDNPAMFSSLGTEFIEKVGDFQYTFLGLNMGDTPSFTSILILIPIVSLLVNLVYTVFTQRQQKKTNPNGQPGGMGMNLVLYIMPLFSAFFAFTVPAGLGMYWIWSSVFMLLQSIVLYRIYTPEKMAIIVQKEKEKRKKSGKKTMYERAMEAQAAQNGTPMPKSTNLNGEEGKLSKSELKEYQKNVLNEARKRMAEKYGDEYNDNIDD